MIVMPERCIPMNASRARNIQMVNHDYFIRTFIFTHIHMKLLANRTAHCFLVNIENLPTSQTPLLSQFPSPSLFLSTEATVSWIFSSFVSSSTPSFS